MQRTLGIAVASIAAAVVGFIAAAVAVVVLRDFGGAAQPIAQAEQAAAV